MVPPAMDKRIWRFQRCRRTTTKIEIVCGKVARKASLYFVLLCICIPPCIGKSIGALEINGNIRKILFINLALNLYTFKHKRHILWDGAAGCLTFLLRLCIMG